jgi:hemoglobin
MMNTRRWSLLAALVAVSILVTAAGTAGAQPAGTAKAPAATPNLYHRLGGYDAIAAVTDDFIGRLAGDPDLGKFFVGHSTESLRRIRQHIVDQLCEATGGPCYYTGPSMKEAHQGMNITEAQWTTAVNHLNATFDKFKVGQQERTEVLAALTALKPDIVTGK